MPFCRNIAVFCGSSAGKSAAYAEAARELGALIGRQGRALVFGGCLDGLMAEVAGAARRNGAPIYSEFVRAFYRDSDHIPGAEEILHDNVRDRKRGLIERSDACVVLPGGMGTLDEFTDVCAAMQLGERRRPVGILNVAGYYDSLLSFFERMRGDGFLSPDWDSLFISDSDPGWLLGLLDAQADQ